MSTFTKDVYDTPESEVIKLEISRNILSEIDPGGDTPGAGNDGDD